MTGDSYPRGSTQAPTANSADERFRIPPAIELAAENVSPIRVTETVIFMHQGASVVNAIGPRSCGIVAADIFAHREGAAGAGQHHGADFRINLSLGERLI